MKTQVQNKQNKRIARYFIDIRALNLRNYKFDGMLKCIRPRAFGARKSRAYNLARSGGDAFCRRTSSMTFMAWYNLLSCSFGATTCIDSLVSRYVLRSTVFGSPGMGQHIRSKVFRFHKCSHNSLLTLSQLPNG